MMTLLAITIPGISVGSEATGDVSTTLQLLVLLTILSLAPAILIMLTSFTRIIIVLSFVRTGLGTQSMPPNQVLIGLALFLTFFVMSPVLTEINEEALQPYLAEEITQQEALETAASPIKAFMAEHTREKDLALFYSYQGLDKPSSVDEIPLTSLIPAFAISELKTAFQIGFIIFIPFLIIDMVVASTLMAMGMMMLPPVMISLPFKILLFILVDGWNLIVESLLMSF
ncbi:flagellar biosynthetic protein FliP [Chryseomicrobium excrementi]|uniref:Flagellar biosynthetic protein FliP n=2 Tax=Chryseomicrobium excrementi TaxID=2041346 RepID=A0A2M9F0Q9_9BACL|nr:flagellar type III secretion system pore protein FliP [Chryseomicrobium excrementi]PJK17049.1 flagellar biosynthetic protein FliP [Chryseomicrobium excrementi]